MARKVRPVHCWGIVKRDYIEMKGFGDCRVMTDPRRLSEDLDITQFWIMTPTRKLLNLAMSEDSYLNVVEFIDDDDEEFTEEIERVMMCELRRGDKFYFSHHKVTFLGRAGLSRYRIMSETGREFDSMPLKYCTIVKRIKKVRKPKPLSFTEFALSSYEKALTRLVEAVSRLQADPARVEVQKPAKKAENTPLITAEDVPAPVVSETKPRACECDSRSDKDCDRSYCVDREPITLDNVHLGLYEDRVLTCSDVIAELEEVRLHEGDLPVSIVNPEDGFRRVNVSGSMLEDLYECGETYWGSRTWDTQPRPGNPSKSEFVVSLW